MLKRVLLAVTFVAALGAAGLGLSSKAEAGHGCYRGYGYSAYYPGYRAYTPAYYGGWGQPRFSYYRGHGHRHHHHHHRGHHHHDRGGVSFSIGF